MNLDYLGLRKESHPFDWLWNLDSGFVAINNILNEGFESLIEKDSYKIIQHYRLESPQVVYREYPAIIHMHSNPMENIADHLTLVKRINRFKEVFTHGDFLHFVYYKSYNEELRKDKDATIEKTLQSMVSGANEFCQIINKKNFQPQGNFHLLLILQTDPEQTKESLLEIKKIQKKCTSNIFIGYTINRNEDLFEMWRKQFKSQLLNNTKMPLIFSLKLRISLLCKKYLSIK
jgi:hypothetical protein